MTHIIDFFSHFILHSDQFLGELIQTLGATQVYMLLVCIIFCETGLVFLPFLPGDSLLFAAGAVSALGHLNIVTLCVTLTFAAIVGDFANYSVGYFFAVAIMRHPRIIKKEHLLKTQAFFADYGAKTIVLARFVPIVRTIAPFLAGSGKMNFFSFVVYNSIGAILWCLLCLLSGYYLGGLSVVKNNFSLIILLVIGISILPLIFEYMNQKRKRLLTNKGIKKVFLIFFFLHILCFQHNVYGANREGGEGETYYIDSSSLGSSDSDQDVVAYLQLIRDAVVDTTYAKIVSDEKNATYILKPKLLHLGESYLVGLEKWNQHGESIYHAHRKINQIDDLDSVSEPLVLEVVSNGSKKNSRIVHEGESSRLPAKSSSYTDTTRENNQEESPHPSEAYRYPSMSGTYFGVGPGIFANLDTDGIAYDFLLAHSWDVFLFARLLFFLDLAFSGNAFFGEIGIGPRFFFAPGNISPYLGFDFGLGLASIDQGHFLGGETVGGFIVGGTGGIEFFRLSDVCFNIGGRLGLLLHENTVGIPILMALNIGVYF